MRRGTSLIEVVVAAAIVAGPLLVTVDLLRSSSREAHAQEEAQSIQLVLHSAMEVLAGETGAHVRELARPESQARLDELVDTLMRTARGADRDWSVRCRVEPVPEAQGRLVLLELSAVRPSGTPVRLRRLFRQRARRAQSPSS